MIPKVTNYFLLINILFCELCIWYQGALNLSDSSTCRTVAPVSGRASARTRSVEQTNVCQLIIVYKLFVTYCKFKIKAEILLLIIAANIASCHVRGWSGQR